VGESPQRSEKSGAANQLSVDACASRAPRWRGAAAPVATCAFVAVLGLIPYTLFTLEQGSRAFVSAFDEPTYLLGDTSTPYRFLSEAILRILAIGPGGLGGLFVAADVLIPVVVAATAWLLARNIVEHDGLRALLVLLLLFGQELFSVANSIVWPDQAITTLRELHPPATLKLIPDATTSYFSLFRTPEPAVSWVLLFGFLALLSARDPLGAFEGRRRIASVPILAVLGFTYPFSSVPIVVLTTCTFVWALACQRSRARPVGVALLLGGASFAASGLISAFGAPVSGTSVVFASRYPIVTPAVVAGTVVFSAFLVVHRGAVARRLELLVPATAAVIPLVVTNQQVLTGVMASARDWERYTNYQLVVFSAAALLATTRRPERARPRRDSGTSRLGLVAWGAFAVLVALLLKWQHDVYEAWKPTNRAAHEIATLLDSLPERTSRYPVVLEEAGLTPLVRLLTDDENHFVLDYTRLFQHPVPSFSEGARVDQPGRHSDELFAHAYRLGWSPNHLEEQIRSELVGEVGGFYSHFVFAQRDVWPPLTDARALRTREALHRLPAIIAAYERYFGDRTGGSSPPALVVTAQPPAEMTDARTNTPVAGSPGSERRVYLQQASE
jgi:hypothetical protein